MLAEHTKPIKKRGDEDEKIKAVVLVVLKSKNKTEFKASVRIKTMLLLRSMMRFYFSHGSSQSFIKKMSEKSI